MNRYAIFSLLIFLAVWLTLNDTRIISNSVGVFIVRQPAAVALFFVAALALAFAWGKAAGQIRR